MECIKLGYQFSSLDEVYAALKEYQKQTEVEFIIRDCRRLGTETEKLRKKDCVHANKALIYYHVKFCCVRGGRHYLPRGTGARNRRTWKTGCPAFVLLSISDCRQYLQIRQMYLDHNHKVVPRPLKRTEARAERRRFRIMHRLKIPYEEAKKIDMLNRTIRRDGDIQTNDMMSKEEIDCNDNEKLEEDLLSLDNFHLAEPNFKPKVDNCYYKAASYKNANTNLVKKMYEADNDECTPGNSLWTSTFNRKRKFKDDNVFETLGTIEELSSSIGFAIEFLPDVCERICYELREIQGVLQEMVIHVGSPKSCNSTQFGSYNFPDSYVTKLEALIDSDKALVPATKYHLVPSGGKGSSALHVARSVCRRAERRAVRLVREQEVDETTVRYLNRLGDYLFIAARMVCISSSDIEHVYKKPESMTVDNEKLLNEEPELQEDKEDNVEIVYLSHSPR